MSLGTSFGAGRHRWRAGVRLMVALVAALLWVSPVDPALAQSSSESGPEIASGPAIVSSPAVGDAYGAGEQITVAFTFSEAVVVAGKPRIGVLVGEQRRWAKYDQQASGGAVVYFAYEVKPANRDDDGIRVKKSSLRLNGGTIADSDGNPARLEHPALPAQTGHKVDGTAAIADGTPAIPRQSQSNNQGQNQPPAADRAGTVTFDPDTPTVGTALTATLSDPDGSVSSLTWAWARSDTRAGSFTDISEATAAAYTPVAGDAGKWLRATASYTDGHGSGKTAAATTAAAVAAAPPTVPRDWALIPKDAQDNPLVAPGEKFRLLFVSSTKQDAQSADIADYNSHVQTAAGNNSALVPFQTGFRALASTSTVDARDNTETTWADEDGKRGVPIYWLGGAQVATSYMDLYDGRWGSIVPTSESGAAVVGTTWVWTGSTNTGEKQARSYLGAATVHVGDPRNRERSLSAFAQPASTARFFYGLSPVITVADPPRVSLVLTPASIAESGPGNSTTVTATLNKAVTGKTTVAVSAAAGTAGAGEFTVSANKTLTIAANTKTSTGTVTITAVDDKVDEDDETVTVSGTVTGTPAAPDDVTLTIIDDDDLPAKPGGFKAFPGDGQVKLSWTDPGDSTITKWQYRQKEGTDPFGSWTDITPSSADTTAHIVTGLTNGTGYSFEVRAVNDIGDGTAADEATATPAAPIAVTTDWALLPSGLDVGDTFRLLFITSTRDNAASADIDVYNNRVQTRAATNTDLKGAGGTAFSGRFRAIGSTLAVDARDNTATFYTEADKGAPIFWLNGAKVADDYEDFYDGSWDSVETKVESGGNSDRLQAHIRAWTGSDSDGTKRDNHWLNAGDVALGSIAVGTALDAGTDSKGASHHLYGLSPLLVVAAAPAPTAPAAQSVVHDWAHIPSGVEAGDEFRLLFITSERLSTRVAGIDSYNASVQKAAATNTALAGFSGEFRALASTEHRDARDNTATTFVDADGERGVPIYWLGGAKVADDYKDLYDGDWDSRERKVESGSDSTRPQRDIRVWTGSEDDGTKLAAEPLGGVSGLASDAVRLGKLSTGEEIDSGTNDQNHNTHHLYALSPVITAQEAPPKVTLVLSPASIAETGGSATVTAELNKAVTGATTVAVSAGKAGDTAAASDFTLSTNTTLTIAANTTTSTGTVTITAVGDNVDEDDETVTVSGTVTGTPAAPDDVTLTIADDDTRGVTVSQTAALPLDEGATATYTVALDSQPAADVTVTPASADATSVTVSGALTFTSANWSTAQTVTVTGVDDTDSDHETVAVTHAVAGAGSGYESVTAASVSVIMTDDDASNAAPAFTDGASTTRAIAENTAADTNVGAAVAATDADQGDTLAYSLGGTDASSFAIDATTGQIKTKAALDFEAASSYSVTVSVTDGTDSHDRAEASPVIDATIAVAIEVTDVDEQPATPAAPTVAATPGSADSLSVSWTAPERNGGPAITGYSLQYREGASGAWSDHSHSGTATTAAIGGLEAGTSHEVRVRALNGETDSDWSPAGSGTTAFVVGTDWSSLPSGLEAGATFRLLFITSTRGDAQSTDIATYNDRVQARAATNTSLAGFSSEFRALASTAGAAVRDNTATNFVDSDGMRGVPIYWLGGAKVADDYKDLYDGSWDSVERKVESGNDSGRRQGDIRVWTGSNSDGTPKTDNLLGDNRPIIGSLGPTSAISSGHDTKTGSHHLYALSPSLFVEAAEPEVTLVLTPGKISEHLGVARVTATLASAKDADVVVTVSAAAKTGSASTTAADFAQTGSKLTISAGELTSTGVVSIAAQSDSSFDDELVTVSATLGSGTAPAPVTLTIVDDDWDCANSEAIKAGDEAGRAGREVDCEILLAARDVLRGSATLDWSLTKPMGNWDGTHTNSVTGRLTGLSVFDMAGSIPAVLGGLTEMDRLFVTTGPDRLPGVVGTLPAELANLSNLVTLNLRDQRLEGAIPSELGRLTNLETLKLEGNGFTGAIPSELGSLTELTDLDLSNNMLTGAIPAALVGNSSAQTGLYKLTDLDLSGNRLTGTVALTAAPDTVYEASGAAEVTVTARLDAASAWANGFADQGSTVKVAVSGSGDTGDLVDFTTSVGGSAASSFDIAIAKGAASNTGTFTLTPTPDSPSAVDEDDETVTVTLAATPPGGPNPSVAARPTAGLSLSTSSPPTITLSDDKAPPGKPGAPSVSALDANRLFVTWSAPSGAPVSYDVQYKLKTATEWADGPQDVVPYSFAQGGATEVQAPEAVIGALTAATAYEVRVRATSATADGPWSEPTEFSTAPAGTAAAGITSVSVVADDAPFGAGGHIDVDVVFSGVIIVTGGKAGAAPFMVIEVGGGDKHAALNDQSDQHPCDADASEMCSKRTFRYSVAGDDLDTDGVSIGANALHRDGALFRKGDYTVDLSHAPVAADSGLAVDGTPPAKPTGLTAAAGDGQVALTWAAPDPADATIAEWQYQYKEGTGSYGAWTDIAESGATTTSHTVTGLTNGELHTFKVRAVDIGANNAESDEAAATPTLSCAGTVATPSGSSAGLVADCEALLKARDELAGSGSLDWATTTAVADWAGVTVAGGRVAELDLSEMSLTGTIPAGLGGLSALEYLDLSDNELTGAIPAELGELSALWRLDVSGNGLTGEIPSELGELSALEYLDLSANALTGSVPAELGDLSALWVLYLNDNLLTGAIPAELATGLGPRLVDGGWVLLSDLDLSGNKLTGTVTLSVSPSSPVSEGGGPKTVKVTAALDAGSAWAVGYGQDRGSVTVKVAGGGETGAVGFAAVADFDISLRGDGTGAGEFTLSPRADSGTVAETVSVTAAGTAAMGIALSTASAATVTIAEGAPTNSDPRFAARVVTSSVDENAAAGSAVGAALSAADPDSDKVEYRLRVCGDLGFAVSSWHDCHHAALFDLDTASGQLTLKAPLNYETSNRSSTTEPTMYVLTVDASDNKDAAGGADTAVDDTIMVMVDVVDVDEPGTVTLSTAAPARGAEVAASVSDADYGPNQLTTIHNIAYKWERLDTADAASGMTIAGATTSAYTPTAADAGKWLRVTVSYNDKHSPDPDSKTTATVTTPNPVTGL